MGYCKKLIYINVTSTFHIDAGGDYNGYKAKRTFHSIVLCVCVWKIGERKRPVDFVIKHCIIYMSVFTLGNIDAFSFFFSLHMTNSFFNISFQNEKFQLLYIIYLQTNICGTGVHGRWL